LLGGTAPSRRPRQFSLAKLGVNAGSSGTLSLPMESPSLTLLTLLPPR
jgi:hypothetical protein